MANLFKTRWNIIIMTLTICPYCGTGCQIEVDYSGDHYTVHGYTRSVVNEGKLCIKGYQGLSYAGSRDRITSPMIRRGDVWTEVSWDEALDYVARRLTEIRDKYGPDSIAFQASAKLPQFNRCRPHTYAWDSRGDRFHKEPEVHRNLLCYRIKHNGAASDNRHNDNKAEKGWQEADRR